MKFLVRYRWYENKIENGARRERGAIGKVLWCETGPRISFPRDWIASSCSLWYNEEAWKKKSRKNWIVLLLPSSLILSYIPSFPSWVSVVRLKLPPRRFRVRKWEALSLLSNTLNRRKEQGWKGTKRKKRQTGFGVLKTNGIHLKVERRRRRWTFLAHIYTPKLGTYQVHFLSRHYFYEFQFLNTQISGVLNTTS